VICFHLFPLIGFVCYLLLYSLIRSNPPLLCVYPGTQKDTFNDEEERFEAMKKQKILAERREFEAVKATMTYDKGKMDNMRRQVCTVCCAVCAVCAVL
jgi:hypothetical protein